MRRAAGGQQRAQHLLGAGLADRAGDRDDLRLRARARGDAKPLHRLQSVVDREHRPKRGELAPRARATRRRRGAGFEGARDMVVAVVRIALDGEEEIAGLKRAGVDRDAADGRAQRRARGGAERRASARLGSTAPSCASSSAARASSASENGSVLSPTIWPVSWPLPAITSASPSRASRRRRGSPPRGRRSRSPRRGGENLRRGSPPDSRSADCRR